MSRGLGDVYKRQVAPFAYAMGIKELIMGSSLIEDKLEPALDGTNPLLTNGFKFVGISFAEQDGLYTRRSQKANMLGFGHVL